MGLWVRGLWVVERSAHTAAYEAPGSSATACELIKTRPGANYHIPGWFNYACGANYPHQALKGGLFCICVESRNLT